MASKIPAIWAVRALIAFVALASLIATISFSGGRNDRPSPATPSTSPSPEATPTETFEPFEVLVTVPDVVAQDLSSARQVLVAQGLTAGVGTLTDEPPELWSVVRVQSPEAGAELPQGESVFLIVTRQRRPDLDPPELSANERCPATPVKSSPRFRQALRTAHAKLGSATEDGVIRLVTDDQPYSGLGADISMLWATAGGYKGPMLVRGGRIDGDGELVFRQDPDPVGRRLIPRGTPSEFHFDRGGAPGGFAWTAVVYFPEPGCYAFQIDGPTFTEHMIVEAI